MNCRIKNITEMRMLSNRLQQLNILGYANRLTLFILKLKLKEQLYQNNNIVSQSVEHLKYMKNENIFKSSIDTMKLGSY